MKFKTSVSLMIAVVLGLVTAKVGLDVLKKYRGQTAPGSKIVVAARDMEPGYVVEQSDLALEEVPGKFVPTNAIKEAKLAAGRTVLASVVKGYPLVDNQLSPAGAGSGMQAMVPKGMRAVTVDVSESSGVAGLLVPGCFVDVIATLRSGDQTVAATVVENVKVQFVQRSRPSSSVRSSSARSGSSAGTGTPDLGPVKTVTLLVTPDQAKRVELANSQGKPRLVLRGNSDGTTGDTGMISQNQLLGIPDEPKKEEAPPPPTPPVAVDESTFENVPPPKPKGRPVQIIKGGTESTITFDADGNQEEGTGAAPQSPPPAADPQTAGKNQPKRTGGGSNGGSSTEPGTASGVSPDGSDSRTDAGRGNLR